MSVARVDQKFFLDTNVFAYSFDPSAVAKQHVAQDLIKAALRTQFGVISTQIVQEFLNLALRKFSQPFSTLEARAYLSRVLVPLCVHFPSITSYEHALLIQAETGYSWYDSLVVAAAVELGCATLFSEDLQHGRMIRGVRIVDPFR